METVKNVYLGLDIGTDSVGYAVTDEQYGLLKYHGEPAWGVTLFDPASLSEERRGFRTARRRVDRRQQRVALTQELFAPEIAKIDPRFFVRLQESRLYREDTGDAYTLFNDPDFTDIDYHHRYPTIHHLIAELMESGAPHDARLVYLACAWLIAHRGHFLNSMDESNVDACKDFTIVYNELTDYFTANEYRMPWECDAPRQIGDILRQNKTITAKTKDLTALLFDGKKPPKEPTEDLPFNTETIIKLLAGGTCKLKDIFCKEEYSELGSVALSMEEDKLSAIMAEIGEDYDLLDALRKLYDWSLLANVLGSFGTVSEAKVAVYEQHKEDLKLLKRIIYTYRPEKYTEVFRKIGKDNYPAYVYHTDEPNAADLKKKNKEDFSKYILSVLKGIEPQDEDAEPFRDMIERLELRTFLPKQKTTDNRVIPYQLYLYELRRILEKAQTYLPFLSVPDADGLTPAEKLMSVMKFRIPYFVGPLNRHSPRAWIERKADGKIYPWNFEDMVDLDKSEEGFIKKLTNSCTYLPGENVLPKASLCYQKFTVLNEINNLRVNGERISVSLKQQIFNDLFLRIKKVTRKKLIEYLIANGVIEKGAEDTVTGIDQQINASCSSWVSFGRLLSAGTLTETQVESIIERSSYAEDKLRFARWLDRTFPELPAEDKKYIGNLKLADFGRLSREFLTGETVCGSVDETGEAYTILGAMWNTQYNLMELLSDRFGFRSCVEEYCRAYYAEHPKTLTERLDEMYISNAVKRPIFRTLDIVRDVTKAFGTPKKIFIEMARGTVDDQKGKRTKSRKQQILDLYETCRDEDIPRLRQQLEAMGDYADNRLQSDKLFLYYMQLGRCMYSGTSIELEKLGTKAYDIDHIYPQAYVKDDSIINNKVLVLSEENGAKSDQYPIAENIRSKMHGYWTFLKEVGLISGEKYKRLTRGTPFTDEEKYGFINRQLTETSQSTKAIAEILSERFPDTEIVYCKAKLASEFRQEFDLIKSRTFNDLHHAVDAYLNIVTGNVYHMKFTKKWFRPDVRYSIKTKTLFTNPQYCGGEMIWGGEEMLQKVKATAVRNNAHFTKFAFFKKGGFFDQMPVSAAPGLTPLKKGLPTEKYGGYNKSATLFFIPVHYTIGKKSDTIIMSVEMLFGRRFLADEAFAREYTFRRLKHILGKDVQSVSFPMGMRPWKVNTMLSLDGFRVCISGGAGGGKCLIAQPVMQFKAAPFWNFYLKKLEMFNEKVTLNPNYIYSEEYDKISAEKNLELYDLYLDKLENSIYAKRVNAPTEIVRSGRAKFIALPIREQTKALLNLHQVFGRIAGGCDLTLIGGAGKAASTGNFSSTVSNWKKKYKDVRIIDASASGLWEKQSENLLELL